MLSILLPSVVLTTATLLSLMAVYSVRAGVFAPVAEPVTSPGSADTLAGSSELVRTVLAPRQSEWKTATLHSLSDVEDLLDTLEAHGVATREVSVVNNNTFSVRWK